MSEVSHLCWHSHAVVRPLHPTTMTMTVIETCEDGRHRGDGNEDGWWGGYCGWSGGHRAIAQALILLLLSDQLPPRDWIDPTWRWR